RHRGARTRRPPRPSIPTSTPTRAPRAKEKSMLRSLYSGISGLRANQTMMDVVGNNIANVNTTGFKASNTVFQDTLSQLVQGASAPSAGRGGTNPSQIGLGVRVAAITTNFNPGA